MTQPIHIEESTVRDLTILLFGKNQHTKLARSAVELLVEQGKAGKPTLDFDTLIVYVDFLIKQKGYN